jgi:nucleotide-binding universal stress UspA family protein
MSYDSILVHLEFDGNSESRLQYATDLAGDLDAFLIGFTAAAVRPVHASELGVLADDAYSEALVRRNRDRFDAIKQDFFEVAGDGHNSGWRDSEDIPTRALLANARAADLIVTGTPYGVTPGDYYRTIDPGDVVCDAGRPVLFVAEGGVYRHPQRALIGWKDTPEARRAVAFALPFLKLAEDTVVLAMQEKEDCGGSGAADVARYLMRHGVDADARTVSGRNGPDSFLQALRDADADLVITGAYGHSRMRERIFGGFTRTLLMQKDLNRLMAG